MENRPWPVHPRSPVSRLLVPMSTSILREANGKHTKHHITQAQRMHHCRPPSKRRKLPAQTDTAHTRPWHTHANSPRMREIWVPQRLMSHTTTGYYHMKMGAALQLAASEAAHFSAHPKHRHSRMHCWHFTAIAAHAEDTDTPHNVQGISIQ